MELIEHYEVTNAAGEPSILFSNIPQTYTDLLLVVSARNTGTDDELRIYPNSSSSNLSYQLLRGDGSTTLANTINRFYIPTSGYTANTFANGQCYIPNYTAAQAKRFSLDSVTENNATTAYQSIQSTLWNDNTAISSLLIQPAVGNLAQYSSATLYGIKKYNTSNAPKATGGIISYSNGYWVHTFTASGTFTPTESLSAEVLVVAGGGGGGINLAGGGGAGGLLAFTGQSLSATPYTVTVGGGGATATTGSDSQFGALTLVKGGGNGGSFSSQNGGNGGSGGGGNYNTGVGGTATSGQGNDGGDFVSDFSSAGGGGAGASGTDGTGTLGVAGGVGTSAYSSWGAFGENVGGTYYLAGGGGGAGNASVTADNQGLGGYGGGGDAAPSNSNSAQPGQPGLAYTGGGGGGGGTASGQGGAGGSGLIVVRYAA